MRWCHHWLILCYAFWLRMAWRINHHLLHVAPQSIPWANNFPCLSQAGHIYVMNIKQYLYAYTLLLCHCYQSRNIHQYMRLNIEKDVGKSILDTLSTVLATILVSVSYLTEAPWVYSFITCLICETKIQHKSTLLFQIWSKMCWWI